MQLIIQTTCLMNPQLDTEKLTHFSSTFTMFYEKQKQSRRVTLCALYGLFMVTETDSSQTLNNKHSDYTHSILKTTNHMYMYVYVLYI